MSQASSDIREAMDTIYDEFGDDAHFTARDCPAVACAVLIDHNLQRYGNVAAVAGKTVALRVRRQQVAEPPRRGDVFDVTSGEFAGRTFTVDSLVASDEFEHRVLAA